MTVLVTGATGTTGSRVAAQLRARGADVRTASRDCGPGRSPHTRLEWNDPATYAPALAGAEQVYLVVPLADPAPAVAAFVDAAVTAGTRRVVLLSSSAVTDTATGLGALPNLVRSRMPEAAVLRPSWFMENFVGRHPVAAGIREHGRMTSATGRGRVAFVDPDDIAAVACELLLGGPIPDGELVLTGPEPLSYDDVAALLTEISGRPVTHESVSVDVLADGIAASGVPRPYAQLLAQMDAAIAGGSEDRVTATVEQITGRAPRSFHDFLTDALARTSGSSA